MTLVTVVHLLWDRHDYQSVMAKRRVESWYGTRGLGIPGIEALSFCVRFVMQRTSGRKRRNLRNYSTKCSGQEGLGIP